MRGCGTFHAGGEVGGGRGRELRSGLPDSETMSEVIHEVPISKVL